MRKRKSSGGLWLLALLGLLLVAGGVTLFVMLSGGGGSRDKEIKRDAAKEGKDGGKDSSETVGKSGIDLSRRELSLERAHYGMPRDRVERVFGKGKPSSVAVINRSLLGGAYPGVPRTAGET